MKTRAIFVCVHNSARSQMAEEILRQLAGDRFETESAGLEPGKINPYVQKVLLEWDIDISAKKTQSVFDVVRSGKPYDYVITVCNEAEGERCPVFPGKTTQRLHWGFPDPSKFQGTEEERLAKTREIRDKIKAKLEEWLKTREENAKVRA